MSQRALKKRDLLNAHSKQQQQEKEVVVTAQIYRKQALATHQTKNALRSPSQQQQQQQHHQIQSIDKPSDFDADALLASKRKFHSTPNFPISERQTGGRILRAQSDSNLNALPIDANGLVNAKSEFHLKSIASTEVPLREQQLANLAGRKRCTKRTSTNVGGKASPSSIQHSQTMQSERMSIQSGLSATTAGSLTSSTSDSTRPPTSGFVDTENIRIPIIGYEVMEERARFTVYKLRVENPFTNDCWLVLRRYTDFQRLNNKLKANFPQLPALILPRKKLFGDNFSSLFLGNRVQGLQIFINGIMANEMLRTSQIVRDFFCLDEPPVYSESVEECRAIFEAQEETIAHLKMQLRAKDELIGSLQQQLTQEVEQNRSLSSAINLSYDNCMNCSKLFDELTMKTKSDMDNTSG